MPRYSELRPLDIDQPFTKRCIHWNREEWNHILFVSKKLRLSDLSSVVKESIRLAVIHLQQKEKLIGDLKEKISEFNLKEHDLFIKE
jgi:hypothetical protein